MNFFLGAHFSVGACLGVLFPWLRMALLGLVLSTFASAADTKETVIRYFPTGEIFEYRWKLLELAMAHTVASDGPVRFVPHVGGAITQSRSMVMLQQGELDVLAFGSNPEREANLLPIRIDILRGILGYRVLLIRDSDQAKFSQLDEKTFREQIRLGFNSQWADYAIWQANGYKLVPSTGYENLFDMLAAGRFDAFPRGLNEIGHEIAEHKLQFPHLVAENTMAFYMEYPTYFWVRKDNVALAERIERGLKLTLADGSFKELFQRYHANEIAQIKREKRRVTYVHNQLLPPGVTPTDTSWWWVQ